MAKQAKKPRNTNMVLVALHIDNNLGGPGPQGEIGGHRVRAQVVAHSKHPGMSAGHPAGRRAGQAMRTWGVVDDGVEYKVIDHGSHIELHQGGAVVWTGHATPKGFATTSSSIPADKLPLILLCVLRGEENTFGEHRHGKAAHAKPAKKPAAKKTAKKTTAKKTTAKKKTATVSKKTRPAGKGAGDSVLYEDTYAAGAHQVRIAHPKEVTDKRIQGILNRHPPEKTRLRTITNALRKVGASFVAWEGAEAKTMTPASKLFQQKAAKKPAKKTTAKGPASKAAPSKTAPAKPAKRAKKPARASTHTTKKPAVAKKRAPRKPEAAPPSGTRASRRGSTAKHGPPTTRSPGTLSDAKFLAELEAHLKKVLPEEAEVRFPALKHIWLAGGREKTLAWMTAHGGKSVIKAFESWVSGNLAEAEAMQDLPARAVA